MRTLVLAVTLLWIRLLVSGSGSRIRRQLAWFDRLPNESLAGVPKIILQYEKYYPRYKDFTLNLFGRSGASQKNVDRARKLQVSLRQLNVCLEFGKKPFFFSALTLKRIVTGLPSSVRSFRLQRFGRGKSVGVASQADLKEKTLQRRIFIRSITKSWTRLRSLSCIIRRKTVTV